MRFGAAGQRTSWSRCLSPVAVGGCPLGELPWCAVSIRISTVDSIGLLEMAHGKANAFDIVFMKALRQALGQAAQSDARAVVITAAGGIFSAGVDLPSLLEGGRQYLEEFLPQLSDGLAELFALPKPVVAAVNGHAIAGGAIIAFACDYRVMARGPGKIGVPELRVGVPFPLVPAEIIRYALGDQRAQRAMLVGQVVEADRAVEEGAGRDLRLRREDAEKVMEPTQSRGHLR